MELVLFELCLRSIPINTDWVWKDEQNYLKCLLMDLIFYYKNGYKFNQNINISSESLCCRGNSADKISNIKRCCCYSTYSVQSVARLRNSRVTRINFDEFLIRHRIRIKISLKSERPPSVMRVRRRRRWVWRNRVAHEVNVVLRTYFDRPVVELVPAVAERDATRRSCAGATRPFCEKNLKQKCKMKRFF